MRHAAEVRLAGSVGRGGLNRWPDVAAVQQLLNEHLPSGVRPLVIDGDAGPLTVDLIARWQRRHGIVRQPDGRVDPGGPTLRALNGARRVHSIPRAEVRKAPPPVAPPVSRRPPRTPGPAVPVTRATPPTPDTMAARGRTPPDAVIRAARPLRHVGASPLPSR
ncbi:peptidoglycan-binding domain-containing protein [Sphingomonas hankookensis]|uniref:peptidoglycan-binding domain-containing protein n=1 Tax=Sphingomonas hankookensis TaxID=563996 RepID=UPI0018DB8BE9